MDGNKVQALITIVFILASTSFFILYNHELSVNRDLTRQVEKFNMVYHATNLKDGVVMGVANTDSDYFCVWTKDQKITDVLEVCTHEYAHTNLGLIDP